MTEKYTEDDDNDDEDDDDSGENIEGRVVVPLVQKLLLHQAFPVRALVVKSVSRLVLLWGTLKL